MNRRKFLKNSIPATAAPLVLNNIPLSPFVTSNMLNSFNCDTSDRALVVVFMMGGNDGLNTLVPMNQYSKYRNYRPSIYVPESGSNSYIELDSSLPDAQKIGLHPVMTPFKSLYDDGKAHIVQNVGYPSANKSHFKSTDLWLSGGDGVGANAGIKSGHFGRFLDAAFPNTVGNPSPQKPDPLGLQLGNSNVSLGYLTNNNLVASANLTDQDPSGFYSVVQDIGTAPHTNIPSNAYGTEIDYIMDVEYDTSIYAQRISSVFQSGSNSSVTYPNHYFARQLQTVARLIAGGSKTKVFLLHAYGFDTHDDQIQTVGNPSVGWHANLLTEVFGAMKAFQDDLVNLGLDGRVITTTMSEFGRKVIENGGNGTDHGTIAPMFLFGTPIEGGVSGSNMDLDLQDNQGAPHNSQLEFDYRSVFTSLYQDWLGVDDNILTSTFGQVYSKVPFVNQDHIVPPPCYGQSLPIVLHSFEAEKVADDVARIQWVTLSEINHDYYIIERSSDGLNFEGIHREQSQENEDSKSFYEVYDNKPLQGINYYRLKSMDLDGSFTYSKTVSVVFRKKIIKSIMTYPNPASEEAFVAINSKDYLSGWIQIYDMEGHELMRSNFNVEKGYHKTPLNIRDLNTGMYMVIISDRKGELANTKLIVAK